MCRSPFSRVLLAVTLLGVLGLSACGTRRPLGLGAEAGVEVDPGRVRDGLRRLTAAADTAGAAARARYAAQRMQRAGLTPVLESAYLLPRPLPPGGADVLGYVPGRHARRHTDLVLVAADQATLAAAAVLEVARVTAARAAYSQQPPRSVLFSLWSPPEGTRGGLRRWAAHPTWDPKRVTAVIIAAPDTAQARATAAAMAGLLADRVAVEVVVPGLARQRGVQVGQAQRAERELRAADLATRLDRAVRAATDPSALLPDSTALVPLR